MNKHLQRILEILQQENLTAGQKSAAIEALKDANKELEITAFKLDKTEKVKHTTAILLEETIAELEQKRKSVESQKRELEIEAALERVRGRSLAMHASGELKEVVIVVFDKLKELGLTFDVTGIQLYTEGSNDIVQWVAALDLLSAPVLAKLPYSEIDFNECEIIHDIWTAKEKGKSFQNKNYSFEDKNRFFEYAGRNNDNSAIPAEVREFQLKAPGYTQSLVAEKHSALWVDSYQGQTISEAEFRTLGRFASVFEQAYVRFLDLQKAEAQARESQIQLALERVRAKTMAMQSSNDLLGVANVLREQMGNLGQPELESSIVHLYNDTSPMLEAWYAFRPPNLSSGEIITGVGIVPKDCSAWSREVMAKYNSSETEYTIVASGDKLLEWYKILEQYASPTIDYDEKGQIVVPEILHYHFSKFSGGALLMISTQEPSAEARELQRRAAVVFDLAYTRFLDLKKAEAQAREAKIEAALEKVRSRSLAMHNSSELSELVATLFDELIKLDLVLARCIIWILNEDKSAQLWMANSENKQSADSYHINQIDHNYIHSIFKGWQERSEHWIYELKDDEKASIDQILLFETELSHLPQEVKQGILAAKQTYVSGAFNKFGLIEASGPVQHTEEQLQILHRFNKVFEQSYTRFLDLQKAEAQAREAQIEASLERVRSKTMAMHNSQDVGETVATLFDELTKLGVEKTVRCGIIIVEDTKQMEVWTAADKNGKVDLLIGHLDMNIHPLLLGAFNAWKNKKAVFTYELMGDNLKDYFRAINNSPDYPLQVELDALPLKMTNTEFYFGEGAIFTFTLEPIPDEAVQIFKRFAGVFGQTYRRYLDLCKAEGQAREAQIEAALARVRARAMAMHKSDELSDVIQKVLEEFLELKIPVAIANFALNYKANNDFDIWSAVAGGSTPFKIYIPYLDHPFFNYIIEDKAKNLEFSSHTLTFEEKNSYFNHIFKYAPGAPEELKNYILESPGFAQSTIYLNSFSLSINKYDGIPFSEDENAIMRRLGKAFEQAYTRFLDLQKAEAQAREAQIEAALERVRGKAMAMHSSEDLAATISAFYHELELFSITPRRCGVGLLDKETHMAELSTMNTTEQGESIEVIGRIKMVGHPVLEGVFDNWLKQKEYHPVLRGREISEYYQLIRPQVAFPEYPNDVIQYGYFFFFVEGGVYAWTEKPLSDDELKIYRRFTTVLSLTYKRYKDLRDAEAREQEAIKQAALDRVRADIASMRNTADLDRITPLIWKELTTLAIPFIRCGVFIMDEHENKVHTYLSTPEGRAIAAYHTPMDDSGNLEGAIEHWRQQKVFITYWDESDFQKQADVLLKQGSITSREQYLNTLPKGGFHLHFLPFRQGMLYVGSHESLPTEVLELVQSLADAFSVAYARYEDFTKLESAKAQIEKTLTDLKQTQTQLVQSEKMASLGELTAGIAHEIQNPLNFVNNFSEVSKELLDEMKVELDKGNPEEAKALAADIIQNLEKINFHGKRADGIVKSMLQHSRKSTDQKELTDLNALCDEYLRLSYHGLRAKDKSFNAKFEIQRDPELPKLNVVPQDIGRVILNLINNAFYAVSERLRQAQPDSGYEPMVTVSTKNVGEKIEIIVKDNGYGIPDSIKEKIFQPFFTTKPTGQGTGLGLSLSYDIITKGHGGEIKMETKEGEGTEFIIQLPNV